VLNCETGQVKKKKLGKGLECNNFFGCGNPLTTRAHDEIQTGIPTTLILATQEYSSENVCVCYQCGMVNSPCSGDGGEREGTQEKGGKSYWGIIEKE
jgi:hypothetical protein